MKLRWVLPVLLAVGFASACSSATGAATSRNDDILTRAELEAADQQDLYRLIERVRPHWLNTRGPTSFSGATTGPNVFFDGAGVGGTQYLRNMPPSAAEEIRYWPSALAASRFGMGHPDGVIDIKSRR
ncbi:MAG: hypothetical protein WEF86_04300 [Gemmatimonadota bacterium]